MRGVNISAVSMLPETSEVVDICAVFDAEASFEAFVVSRLVESLGSLALDSQSGVEDAKPDDLAGKFPRPPLGWVGRAGRSAGDGQIAASTCVARWGEGP